MLKATLKGRLQVSEPCVESPFSAHDIVAATQERVESGSCMLEDRTDSVPPSMDDEIAIVRFLASIVNEAVAAGGKRLFYVQRTSHNTEGFVALFAMVKFGAQLAVGRSPIRFAAPGWLAWCRDDYFFGSPTYDLQVSSHVLHGFIVGNTNCCICLDAMFEEKSSIGLECGHLIHVSTPVMHVWIH